MFGSQDAGEYSREVVDEFHKPARDAAELSHRRGVACMEAVQLLAAIAREQLPSQDGGEVRLADIRQETEALRKALEEIR
jgi:hypothetical protein